MSTVLIIDDSRTERELLGKIVTAAGHTAAFAGNGEEGVQKAGELKPALILMDVVMPGMDGFNACRRLKRDAPTAAIPVVIITSKGSESDLFWGKKQGADDYIIKPFAPDRIKAVLKRFLP